MNPSKAVEKLFKFIFKFRANPAGCCQTSWISKASNLSWKMIDRWFDTRKRESEKKFPLTYASYWRYKRKTFVSLPPGVTRETSERVEGQNHFRTKTWKQKLFRWVDVMVRVQYRGRSMAPSHRDRAWRTWGNQNLPNLLPYTAPFLSFLVRREYNLWIWNDQDVGQAQIKPKKTLLIGSTIAALQEWDEARNQVRIHYLLRLRLFTSFRGTSWFLNLFIQF